MLCPNFNLLCWISTYCCRILSSQLPFPLLFSHFSFLISQGMHITFSPSFKLLQTLGRSPWGGAILTQQKCKTEIHITSVSCWEYAVLSLWDSGLALKSCLWDLYQFVISLFLPLAEEYPLKKATVSIEETEMGLLLSVARVCTKLAK